MDRQKARIRLFRLLAAKPTAPWKLNVFIVELNREVRVTASVGHGANNETGFSNSAGEVSVGRSL